MRNSPCMRATLALLVTLGLTSTAPAETPEDPLRKVYTPLVTTPSRLPQTPFNAARNVVAIPGEVAREKAARSLPEILEDLSGVHIQMTNRGAGAPIIRGAVGPQNLILVDGVRFNTATFRTGPNQYLALLDPHAIRSIEVVRGASSVLYGSGAMGGVLQVLLREPIWPTPTRFSLSGEASGRFAAADLGAGATLSLSGGKGPWAFLVGGSFDHFGDQRSGGGGTVPLSAYDAGYWHAKLRYQSRPTWNLTGAYIGMAMRNAGRTDKLGRGEARYYDNDDHLAYLRFNWKGKGTVRTLRMTTSFHRLDEVVDRFNCATNPDKTVADLDKCSILDESVIQKKRQNTDRVNALGFDAEMTMSLLKERIRLALGLEGYYDMVSSERQDASSVDGFVFSPKPRGNFSEGSTYLTFGTFLHADTLLLGGPKFRIRLNGGLRFSAFVAHAPDVPGLGDVDYQFTGLVGSAGVQLILPKRLNLYGAFIQGFRAPNLQETTVIGNTGSKFEIPNPDLKPERSDTIEIGAKLDAGPLKLRLTYYYAMLKDAIDEKAALFEGQPDVDGTPVVQRINATSGQTHGLEAVARLTIGRFQLRTGIAYAKSEVTDADGDTTPSRRIPPIFGSTGLRYTHPGKKSAYVELYIHYAGRQTELHPSDRKDLRICETGLYSGVLYKDIGQDCQGTAGYVTAGIRGGWRFHRNLRADLNVSNLLDAKYRVFGSGSLATGIDGRLSLTGFF